MIKLGKNKKIEKTNHIGKVIWMIATAFFLYEFFLRTFLGSLAVQIMPELHLSANMFSVIASSYYLVYGFMQLPVGILINKFGIKKIMIFSSALCSLSGILFSFSRGFWEALFCRLLMGFASSFAFICLLGILTIWFSKKHFGVLSGISQLIGTIGPILAGGPLVIFLKNSNSSWQTIIFYIGCAGFFITLLSLLFIKNKKGNNEYIKILSKTIPLKKQVMLLFKNKKIWLIAIISSLLYQPAIILGAVWGTKFLQSKNISQSISASIISILWLGYAIGACLFGWISDHSKRRKLTIQCSIILGISSSIMICFFYVRFSIIYGILFFLLGISCGGSNVGFTLMLENTKDEFHFAALGIINGMLVTVSFFSPILFGSLMSYKYLSNFLPHFSFAFLLIPIIFIVALILSIFIKETYGKAQKKVFFLEKQNNN